jgi:preprotein translocase subunit SecG
MQIWINLILIAQILAAITMIGLVLIQHGKGADMGASFGSGASGSLFGATGGANFLSRTTAVCAGIFFATTLALAMLSNQAGSRVTSSDSVLERAAALKPPAAPASAALAASLPSAPAASAPAQIPKP